MQYLGHRSITFFLHCPRAQLAASPLPASCAPAILVVLRAPLTSGICLDVWCFCAFPFDLQSAAWCVMTSQRGGAVGVACWGWDHGHGQGERKGKHELPKTGWWWQGKLEARRAKIFAPNRLVSCWRPCWCPPTQATTCPRMCSPINLFMERSSKPTLEPKGPSPRDEHSEPHRKMFRNGPEASCWFWHKHVKLPRGAAQPSNLAKLAVWVIFTTPSRFARCVLTSPQDAHALAVLPTGLASSRPSIVAVIQVASLVEFTYMIQTATQRQTW